MVEIFPDRKEMAEEIERLRAALRETELAYEAAEERSRHRGKILHKAMWHVRALATLLSGAR